jgi:hypothetical protein
LPAVAAHSSKNKRFLPRLDRGTEAKQPTTRKRRLKTTIEWLAEGKQQNWKYLEQL